MAAAAGRVAGAAANGARKGGSASGWQVAGLAGGIALSLPTTWMLGLKVWHNDELESAGFSRKGSNTIKNFREERKGSLQEFKEAIYQRDDPKAGNYDPKSYDRFNKTELRKTKSFRPGGELSKMGSAGYKQYKADLMN